MNGPRLALHLTGTVPTVSDRPATPEEGRSRRRRSLGAVVDLALLATLALIVFIDGGILGNPWYRMVSITGGSMEPTIARGDLVVVGPVPSTVEPGMILVMTVGGQVVTHRVVTVNDDGTFVTRGDANTVDDDWTGQQVQVDGQYVATIPWLGHILPARNTSAATFRDGVTAAMHLTVGPFPAGPVAVPTQAPPANGAGWNSTGVVVRWNWSDPGSPIDPAACTLTSPSVGEGIQTLTATCKDLAGNTGSASYTVKVDKTPPAVAISGHPANPTSSSSALFAFTATDTGGSGIASVTCQIDAGPATPCTSPQTYSLAAGTHTFTVTATDVAGNVSRASFTWCIKGQGPSISVAHTADGSNGWNRTSPVVLVITVTPGTASVTAKPTCTDNRKPLPVTGTASPYAASLVGEGSHAIVCTVTDTANRSATGTDTVRIDTGAPKVTPPATVTVDATSPSGAVVSYCASFSDPTSGVATSSCSPRPGSTFPIGATTVTCRATDKAGNTTSKAFTITVRTLNQTKAAVLSSLQAQLAATKATDTKTRLAQAITHVGNSLAVGLWVTSSPHADGNHLDPVTGGTVFDEEKAAVSSLLGIRHPTATVKAVIASLEKVDRLLAQFAIDDAIAAHADPGQISLAQKQMTTAQTYLSKGHADTAIASWKTAWRLMTPTPPPAP